MPENGTRAARDPDGLCYDNFDASALYRGAVRITDAVIGDEDVHQFFAKMKAAFKPPPSAIDHRAAKS